MRCVVKVLLSAPFTIAVAALPGCTPARRPPSEVQRAVIADTLRRLTGEIAEAAGQVSAERTVARLERGTEFAFANNGTVSFSADSVLAAFRRDFAPLRRQDITLGASKVSVLGPDAAVVTTQGVFTYTDSAGATSSPIPLAWTIVWARRDGQWRAVHTHQSFGAPRR